MNVNSEGSHIQQLVVYVDSKADRDLLLVNCYGNFLNFADAFMFV